MKLVAFGLMLFFSCVTFAQVTFDEGQILWGSYESVKSRCLDKGMRLPSALEFAEWATSYGAVDIQLTAYPNMIYKGSFMGLIAEEIRRLNKRGYLMIARNAGDGEGSHVFVEFYYNFAKFKLPKHIAIDNHEAFWTTTIPDNGAVHMRLGFGWNSAHEKFTLGKWLGAGTYSYGPALCVMDAD